VPCCVILGILLSCNQRRVSRNVKMGTDSRHKIHALSNALRTVLIATPKMSPKVNAVIVKMGTDSRHKIHALSNAPMAARPATLKMYPKDNASIVLRGTGARHKRRASETAHFSIVAPTTVLKQKLGLVLMQQGISTIWYVNNTQLFASDLHF
jgi:hypothetical protein